MAICHRKMCHDLPYARQLRVEQLEDRRMLSTITVNTLVDENNGIGVGGISLRDAIAAAMPGDTIDFSVIGTINLAHGQLQIGKSLTIQGPGAGLLGIQPETIFDEIRMFFVSNASASLLDVELSGMTLRNGNVVGVGAAGGAIINAENLTVRECALVGNNVGNGFGDSAGGAIYNIGGSLAVIDSTISGNTCDGSGGGIAMQSGSLTVSGSTIGFNSAVYFGGGIRANGSVTVSESTIANNMVFSAGGGIYVSGADNVTLTGSLIADNSAAAGGGIYRNGGNLNVAGSTFETNDATSGGGIFLDNSTLMLADSLVTGNTVTSQGGGLYGVNGQMTISNCTLVGNTASYGGGLLGRNNTMTIQRSTISGNQSPNSNGGGIESVFATLIVTDSTISGNVSGAGGGILSYYSTTTISHSTITGNNGVVAGGGINVTGPGSMSLSHTIVANNLRGAVRDDVSGTASAQYSLIGDNSGSSLFEAPIGFPDANGNLVGGPLNGVIGPLLGLLADNGGPTLTHALLPGSPAVNAGNPGFIGPPDYDQRGFAYNRVVNGRIDIGAFELGAASADFDNDGDVDGLDFLAWQRGFGTVAPNAMKADGDADNDMDVDADDLAAWENAYGAGGELPAISYRLSAEDHVATRAARSPATASALSARLVDLALAADGTDETNETYGELAPERIVAQDLRVPTVTGFGAAPRHAVADFGDIVVSRPGEDDGAAFEASLEDERVFASI